METRPTSRPVRAMIAAAALWLAAAPVLAAGDGKPAPMPSPLSGTELLSMSMNLLLVIGAILLFGWIYSRSQGLRAARNGHFRVLAAQPLGAKEKVVLLQVGEQQVVVGISPGGMNTLLVPEKPVVPFAPAPGDDERSFTERLRAAVAGTTRERS
ncbi:flagellar biosynthetic protein FliO [Lentisalinibacter orientalis]|uniref:flagellar biosynthetic protein FliO n=1 Tax=Lentisalinibacter orientalis TaxID=2992241 RepID=UPI003865539A